MHDFFMKPIIPDGKQRGIQTIPPPRRVTAKEKNMKSIMIHCTCPLTRLGLEYAISSHPGLLQQTNLVYYPTSGFFPLNYPVPDVLLLVLHRNIAEAFASLEQILLTPLRDANVLLVLPRDTPYWIRRYILGRVNVLAELNMTVSVGMLQSLLFELLVQPQARKKIDDVISLSRREQEVIRRLLLGKNSIQIAFDLGISSKTVSSHKHKAFLKLGVRSLHGLQACSSAYIAS